MSAFTDALGLAGRVYRGRLPTTAPGMTGEDVVLYAAWAAAPYPVPQVAAFNVRVGPPPPAERAAEGGDAELAAQLLALRIDLLLFDGAEWWVVEFHHTAGLPQLGRLICYPDLLARSYPDAPAVRTLAVVQTWNRYLLPCFTERRIPVLSYPPGAPAAFVVNFDAFAGFPERLRPPVR